MSDAPIKVLVVDDSSLMRQVLTELLNGVPDIKVVSQAPDPYVASDMIKLYSPDVMTLDVEMPRMDGLSFLEKIMTLHPMPVVMVSTLTAKGAEATMRALELGAVDYVTKPTTDLRKNLSELAEDIRSKVRMAAKARVRAYRPGAHPVVTEKKAPATVAVPVVAGGTLIAMGSSTGGVEAVTQVLTQMPENCPPILITQHMPEKFTASFAQRLNAICKITVEEAAQTGTKLQAGHAYIAPGGYHMELSRVGANYIYKTNQEPAVSGHRPSVDVLFRSVAHTAGANAIGVILTGMGKDGAAGLLEMRKAGAPTFGQDEATCVVYGMPKVAFDIGAVEKQLGITQMAAGILEKLKRLGTKV